MATLRASKALWNRRTLDLASQETVVQIMDRGSIADWQALAALALTDTDLTARMLTAATTVPLATAWFWQAALASRGLPVPWCVAADPEL